MESNKQKNTEQESSEYSFVRETIIDRKTRIKRELLRLVTNFFFIIFVCIVTCIIFVRLSMEKSDNTTTYDESTSEDVTSESLTTEETTTDELSKEELDNIKYLSGIITFTGMIKEEHIEQESGDEKATVTQSEEETETIEISLEDVTEETSIDVEDNSTKETVRIASTGKTDEMISENTRKFIGAVVIKDPYLIAITSASNIESIGNIYADVLGKKGLPVEVVYVDKDFDIAYLSINRSTISYSELESIGLMSISPDVQPAVGKKTKFCGIIQGVGMSVIDGVIVSSGEEEIILDTVLRQYLVDISLSGVKEGFIFDENGYLTAMAMIDETEDSKIKVLDLGCIKTRVLDTAKEKRVVSFGVKGQTVTAEIEELVGNNLPDGMYVTYVEIDSPAYRAGIMVGDIIYRIGVYSVDEIGDIRRMIDERRPGDVVSVNLYRNMGTKYNTYTLPLELAGIKWETK